MKTIYFQKIVYLIFIYKNKAFEKLYKFDINTALMPHLNAQVQKNISPNNTVIDSCYKWTFIYFFCLLLLLRNEHVFILYTDNCMRYRKD